jgi:hypothetical protein
MPITPDTQFAACKGVYCTTQGLATIADAAGTQILQFPMQSGYNPISITEVSSAGQNYQGMFALY